MSSLYNISDELATLVDILDRTQLDDALMSPEDKATVEQRIAELRSAADGKTDGYARCVREYQTRADGRRAEANRLLEAAREDEARVERIKRFLMFALDRMGTPKIRGSLHEITVRANGGAASVDVFTPADVLPERFRLVEYKPNKTAIREALERGDHEVGQFATLMERGRSIIIK
jgi:hypothetical protein